MTQTTPLIGESSKRNYYIISLRVIIKAIIIITPSETVSKKNELNSQMALFPNFDKESCICTDRPFHVFNLIFEMYNLRFPLI